MSNTLILMYRSGKLLQNSCSTNAKRLFGFQGLCWRPTATNTPNCAALSTATETTNEQNAVEQKPHKLSKAMKAYLERAQAHDAFMSEQIAEYEIGRRHLANIMGEDPETFTDDDKDRAIAYLFPSGLFEPRARPQMKHPHEVFPKRKAAEFDESGRPFHTLFYTGMPNYFQVLHDVAGKVRELDHFFSKLTRFNVSQDQEKTLNVGGSAWLSKEEFESKIIETVNDRDYEFFVKSMARLVSHPLSYRAKEFIMNFRKEVTVATAAQEIPKLMFTAEGVPYMTSSSKRKTAVSNVTVYGRGSGSITLNGQDILYFRNIQEREQIVFPLQFSGLLGTVDVVADVDGGGITGQSGAIRHGISMALRSFVDTEMVEKMRLAGLLTHDPRRRERKKPGQKGARAKFTWKKR